MVVEHRGQRHSGGASHDRLLIADVCVALEPVVQLTGVAGAHGVAARLARDLREEHAVWRMWSPSWTA